MLRIRLSITGGLWLAMLAGCNGGEKANAPAPAPPTVASVTVLPATVMMVPGERTFLTATTKDAFGNVLSDHRVAWASSSVAVATVDAAGTVTGVAPGQAAISATSDGKVGTALVTVNAAQTPTDLSGQIAFVSRRDGRGHIYLMNLDGSGVTRLTNQAVDDDQPAWSPDGSRITFTRYVNGVFEIYVMNDDGSHIAQLTRGGGENPAWSPDGATIAFAKARTDSTSDIYISDIYVMNADGSGVTMLKSGTFDTATAHSDIWPAWSPDGLQIAFTRRFGDPFSASYVQTIYVVRADGSAAVDLRPPFGGSGPVWSRDGKVIWFWSLGLAHRNSDGSGSVAWISMSVTPGYDGPSAWSPDGSRIAWASPHTTDNGFGSDIYLMKEDGSRPVRITTDGLSTHPAWRPR